MPDDFTEPERWRRLPAFLVGGGLATLCHWLALFILIQLDSSARFATAVGGALGLAINYLLQYHMTFRSARPHRVTLPRYLAGAGVGWLLNLAFFDAVYRLTASALLAQTVSTGVTTFINFVLADRFVFHDTSIQTPQ